MLPLWLLLPLVDGVSQNVSDYCKEMHARRPQRANVVLALRGELPQRRRPGHDSYVLP